MNYEVLQKYTATDLVLVSKGENRSFVEQALAEMGIEMPAMGGRRLHD